MKKTTIIEIITVLYVILFLYTGISKFLDYRIFEDQLSASPILSPVSKIIAIAVPSSEFVAVLLLLIPKWRLRGLFLSTLLMVTFTIYIILVLSLSDHLPCSCGGIIELMSWTQHLIFNSLFLALAIIGIIIQKRISVSERNDLATIHHTLNVSTWLK